MRLGNIQLCTCLEKQNQVANRLANPRVNQEEWIIINIEPKIWEGLEDLIVKDQTSQNKLDPGKTGLHWT